MGGHITDADWDDAGLGSGDNWPPLLRSAADIILQTGLPMLLAWGPDLRMFFNQGFAGILGDVWGEALGKGMREAWAGAWPEFGDLVERALLGETVQVEDFAVRTQRSGFTELGYFSFSYSPLIDGKEVVGLVCVCLETTESVGRDKQWRQMQSEVIHVSRLTAMRAMASTLAHELNQPLAAVGAYLAGVQRLLQSDPPPSLAILRNVIHEARESSERAAEIVRRTRELLRSGVPRTESVDVLQLVATALDVATAKEALRNVRLRKHIESGAAIECDEIQIQQVLINLVRNALEAMETTPAKELTIHAQCRDGDVLFMVEDSGRGVPELLRPKLFEAFQSGKDGGMGVGLSISRTIVEAHGGRLWLERSSECGTRFCFTVPSLRAADLPPAVAAAN